MATTVWTDSTNFTSAVGVYYDKKMIEQLKPRLVLYEHAEKRPVPLNQGNVVKFYKYKEFPYVMQQITEGTTPSAEEFSARQVSVTLAQFFQYQQVSDIVDMTAINPVVDAAIEPISDRAAITIDSNILWALSVPGASNRASGYGLQGLDPRYFNGTNGGMGYASDAPLSLYMDGQLGGLSTLYLCVDGSKFVTSWATLYSYMSALGTTNGTIAVDSMKISAKGIRAAVAKLWRNNAQPADGVTFTGVCSPEVYAQLAGDDDFIRWNQFANDDKGAKGTIGEFAGVRWTPSQSMFLFTRGLTGLSMLASNVGAFSGTFSLIFGEGCYGVSELTGKGGVKVIVKNPGPSDTSNPGDLYSTVGAKVTFAATVLEPKKGYFLFNTVRA